MADYSTCFVDGCPLFYHKYCPNPSEIYYCQRCKQEDPSLRTVFRLVPAEKIVMQANATNIEFAQATPPNKKKEKEKQFPTTPGFAGSTSITSPTPTCKICERCQRSSCGMCDGCLFMTFQTIKKYTPNHLK